MSVGKDLEPTWGSAPRGPQDEGRVGLGPRLRQARALLAAGDHDEARAICAELLEQGQAEGETLRLLAEIYRVEGDRQRAQDLDQRAAGLPPALGGPGPRAARRDVATEPLELPTPPVYWLVVVGGLFAAVALAAAAWLLPRETQSELLRLAPYLMAGGAGLLAGSALAASGLIRTFDQELSDSTAGGGLLWLALLMVGVISVPVAVLVYGIAAQVRGEFGATMILFLATVVVLGAILAAPLGGGWHFWLVGLNLVWVATLVGWALGSVGSPREWWRG